MTHASIADRVSFAEFLARAEGQHAEWEDGKIMFMSPVSVAHQDLGGWLIAIIRIYVRRKNLGKCLSAPVTVKLQATNQAREPDLMFLKTAHLDRLKATHVVGPPDLVVEITSPESITRDTGRKFTEYEQEGIPEYWLLDPRNQAATFYHLGDDARYHAQLPDASGIYFSRSLTGFWLKTDWLWQNPHPDELDVLRQLGIVA